MTAPSGGTTTDAARYLRDTAKLMRQWADQAPHGRWKWMVGDNPARWQLVTNDTLVDIATCTEDPDCPPVIAEHIASWDPTVARAVAALLDMAAGDFDDVKAACVGTPYEPDEVMSEQIRVNVNAALAIARAYRREVAS